MKKINFIQLFDYTTPSYLEKIVLLIITCYLLIIISMHSMQGYTWYHLSKQNNQSTLQKNSLDSAILKRAELEKSKQLLQEKITFFNQQKKDATAKCEQLKTLYCNPFYSLSTVAIKNNQFSLTLKTQTMHQAHAFLKELKSKPLIRKARIIYLNKNNADYLAEIKGKFNTQIIT